MTHAAQISLYHGTTAVAAEAILKEGFKAPDIDAVLLDVSERHGVAVSSLMENLKVHSSYLVSESDRGSRVSFTPNREKVESTWAQNAPEHLREALWAVWRVKYSTHPDPYAWAQDVAGHAWVIGHLAQSEPVTLELKVGIDELMDLRAQAVSFAARALTPELLPALNLLPEIAFPVPFQAPRALTVHQLERRIGWDVFAHWLRMDVEEFRKRHEAGEFGDEGIGRYVASPWWPLRVVDEVLERFGCR
ncbi:hypothetical protein [Nocardioides ochotonae]|uniref:hypothetical protein n=1 Tax=Nocardioides ochotonae TaxID=2685869 RepID=UPI00140E3A14|nr:hypothetical protein [Nocardioides ochotonae]